MADAVAAGAQCRIGPISRQQCRSRNSSVNAKLGVSVLVRPRDRLSLVVTKKKTTTVEQLQQQRQGRRLRVRADGGGFERLNASLENAWGKLQGLTELTEENTKEPLRDIRRSLLEADVSLPVVRRFVKRVQERAQGQEVINGVTPQQMMVKFVYEELKTLMGGRVSPLNVNPASTAGAADSNDSDGASTSSQPAVILMAGLQGVGKTTACGKLAVYLKEKLNKNVLLVATDVYRPAAVDQLVTIAGQVGVDVFERGTDANPAEIAQLGIAHAYESGNDVVIVDTAGRLTIDGEMMDELAAIKSAVQPDETLLVVDAMTGQEAANLCQAFNESVGITGAILTKADGDSRGGAALSVREVSGRPIKFVGTGEKMSALEPFYPDRMAGRILGMGDVLTLVEKAQSEIDRKDAQLLQEKLEASRFDFDDFMKQTKMLRNMGSLKAVMKLIPGMNKVSPGDIMEAEKSVMVFESMINSMTRKERKNPDMVAGSVSRQERIAKGSGRELEQVQEMLREFQIMRVQMANMSRMIKGDFSFNENRPIPPGKARRKKILPQQEAPAAA